MKTLYQSPENRKYSISEFTYDPVTRKFFRYGMEWRAAGVNAALGKIEGVKASVWLRRQTEGQ